MYAQRTSSTCCRTSHVILAGAIFLLVVGPVLIISGIAVLLADNNRAEQVEEYNQAILDYQPVAAFVAGWSSTTGRQANRAAVNMPSVEKTVEVKGSKKDVNEATSTLREGAMTTYDVNGGGVTITVSQTPNQSNPFTLATSFPFTKSVKEDIKCTKDSCSSGCQTTSEYKCNIDSKLEDTCEDLHGLGARFKRTNSNCNDGEICGRCEYTGYATEMCAVVEVGLEGELSRSSINSCYYPFNSDTAKYSATKPRELSSGVFESTDLKIQLRSSKDPLVVLERLTDGDRNFGLTAEQQRNIGIGLLVAGIVIVLILVGVCFCFCKVRGDERKEDELRMQQQQQQQGQCEMTPTSGVPVYPASQGQQQVYYGQPQPYPQQAGGYPNGYSQNPGYPQAGQPQQYPV